MNSKEKRSLLFKKVVDILKKTINKFNKKISYIVGKMNEELFEESRDACKAVADKIEEMDEELTPIEIKMMVEEELGYGLDKDEILVLALTFKHIDELFEKSESGYRSTMIYR